MKFQRALKIGVEEGIDLIRAHMHKSKNAQRKRVRVGEWEVSLNSLRLYTFATHPPCCSNPDCTVKAAFFAVELQTAKDGRPVNSHHQLNLYGVDKEGNTHLMTHDHTMARSLGGEDSLTNTSTMCARCNRRKSVFESQEVERRRMVADGRLPFMPPIPPPEGRAVEYLADLVRAAEVRGMETDEYRSHCALMGTTLGPPLRGLDFEEGFAQALGLSRVAARMHVKLMAQSMTPGVDLVEEPVHQVDFDGDIATLAPIKYHYRKKT